MKFTDAQLECFLSDTPFYQDKKCYCLGNSMSEAGDVISNAMKGETSDVGVDSKNIVSTGKKHSSE